MSLKHPIQFIKKYRLNITLFLILCVLSYFIYKKHKGDLIEGSDACSSSPTTLCKFNMELMNRYNIIVDNLQKKIDVSVNNTVNQINDYKSKRNIEKNKLQAQATKNLSSNSYI